MHDGFSRGVALEAPEQPGPPPGPGLRGARSQPFVEHIAIDHADKTAVDRHIDLLVRRRHHTRGVDARHQQMVGNIEIPDQPRRDRAAAWFYAPGAIEQ